MNLDEMRVEVKGETEDKLPFIMRAKFDFLYTWEAKIYSDSPLAFFPLEEAVSLFLNGIISGEVIIFHTDLLDT